MFSRLGCADDAIANFPPTLDADPRRKLRRGPAILALKPPTIVVGTDVCAATAAQVAQVRLTFGSNSSCFYANVSIGDLLN